MYDLYEKKIKKAITEDELIFCILGFDEYEIRRPNSDFSKDQNYSTLLDYFDEYNKKYPYDELSDKYYKAIVEECKRGKMAIYCLAECVLTHIDKLKNKEFTFPLKNKLELLKYIAECLAVHKEEITTSLRAVNRVSDDRFYNAVVNDMNKAIQDEKISK